MKKYLLFLILCLGVSSFICSSGFPQTVRDKDPYAEEIIVAQRIEEPFKKGRALLQIVNKLLENNEIDRALSVTESIDNRFAFKDDAFVKIANKCIEIKQYDKAFQIAESKIGWNFKRSTVDDIAVKFAENGQYDWAIKIAGRMMDEIDRSDVLGKIAGKYISLGEYDKAFSIAKIMGNPHPQAEVISKIIDHYLGVGQYDKAFELAQNVGGGWRTASCLIKVIGGFAESEKYDKAYALYEKLESPDAKSLALVEMSNSYFQKGQKDEALDLLSQAITIGDKIKSQGNIESLWSDIVEKYVEFGFLDEATELTKRIPDTFPNRIYLWGKIADKFVKAGNDIKAVELLNKNIKDVYSRESLIVKLGLESISKTQEIQDFNMMFARGIAYGQNNIDEAIKAFTKAIEINPNHVEVYVHRGHMYALIEKFEEAIADCNMAIKIKPDFPEAFIVRADVYFAKKEYEKSWDDIHKAEALGYDRLLLSQHGLEEKIRPHITQDVIKKYENDSWKESEAKSNLKILYFVCNEYRSTHKSYPKDLKVLANDEVPPMIPSQLAAEEIDTSIGYRFEYTTVAPDEYQIFAVPIESTLTKFYIDQSGLIRKNDSEGEVQSE